MSALSACALAERIASGALSARAATEACLARIAERNEAVRAFVAVSPDHALAQAEALDRHRKAGRPLGPLHGVPVAVKDIFDTTDFPTENGTVLDAGRRPRADATVVSRLRAAGAVIIGKATTTELAFMQASPARNPHDTAHTPGGSSAGSAVAVADGMVPLAVGTQTGGSVLRPASFCGVVGVKLSLGTVPMTGSLHQSEYLDTAGVFASSVADAALILNVLQGYDPDDPMTRMEPVADLLAATRAEPPLAPRFAVVKGPTWNAASDDMAGLLTEVSETLGELAEPVDLPEAFENALPSHRRIMAVGFARNFRPYMARGESEISAVVREVVEEGAATSAVDFLTARDWQSALTAGIDRVFDRYDAILTPAAAGEAPRDVTTTGNPAFNALWTFLGAPAVTLPVGTGSAGMPIGLQVVGRPREDARLMRTAAWLERRLADG